MSTACATLAPKPARRLRTLAQVGAEPIVASLPHGLDPARARFVEEALGPALRRLEEHGLSLRHGVEIRVHEDPAAFAAATGKTAPWLRAWAGYDVIDLTLPEAWSDPAWPAPVERLAHELCHCAVYQAFGDEQRAIDARIPFFFEEGTASVVAGQERRRMPLVDVARRAAGACPLDEGLVARAHHLAYGAAHHAVAFLARTQGRDVMARVIADAASRGGRGCVEAALQEVTGLSPCALWNLVAAAAY